MSDRILRDASVDQLVDRFAELAVRQDRALLGNEISKVNSLFRDLQDIATELKNRDGDQRRALLRLYDHANPQVRLKAVKATLAVEPITARRALQEIADSREYPQAGEAGMSLWNLDRGVYKPT